MLKELTKLYLKRFRFFYLEANFGKGFPYFEWL